MLSTRESPVAFHLHSALIGPDHVFKGIVQVFLGPGKPSGLVGFSDKLAVGGTSERPA